MYNCLVSVFCLFVLLLIIVCLLFFFFWCWDRCWGPIIDWIASAAPIPIGNTPNESRTRRSTTNDEGTGRRRGRGHSHQRTRSLDRCLFVVLFRVGLSVVNLGGESDRRTTISPMAPLTPSANEKGIPYSHEIHPHTHPSSPSLAYPPTRRLPPSLSRPYRVFCFRLRRWHARLKYTLRNRSSQTSPFTQHSTHTHTHQ